LSNLSLQLRVIVVDDRSDANVHVLRALEHALSSSATLPDVLQVSASDFRAMFSALPASATPQNIGALCALPAARAAGDTPPPPPPPLARTLIIDGLRDPSNAAAVLRRRPHQLHHLHLHLHLHRNVLSSFARSAAAFSAREVVALEGAAPAAATRTALP
jgi:hypothetical protein